MAAALAADPSAAIPPLLQLEGISHRFRKRRSAEVDQPILQELHLELAMAEISVLLGPSGCGKSTLLNLAAGLVELQRGPIHGWGWCFSNQPCCPGSMFIKMWALGSA